MTLSAEIARAAGLDAGRLAAAGLHALRLLPVAALSPFLGGPLLPPAARLALGGGAGLAAFLLGGARPIDADGLALLGLAARELAVGAAIAVVAAAPVDAARAAGRLADTFRGATLAELHVAPLRQRETAVGDLLVHLLVALAAAGGGARLLVRGLLLSFVALPVGGAAAPAGLAALALRTAAAALQTAVAVATPAAAGVLAADLAVAAAVRLAPGLSLTAAVQPARAALGLFAVAAGAAAGAGRLAALVIDAAAALAGAPGGWP